MGHLASAPGVREEGWEAREGIPEPSIEAGGRVLVRGERLQATEPLADGLPPAARPPTA